MLFAFNRDRSIRRTWRDKDTQLLTMERVKRVVDEDRIDPRRTQGIVRQFALILMSTAS